MVFTLTVGILLVVFLLVVVFGSLFAFSRAWREYQYRKILNHAKDWVERNGER